MAASRSTRRPTAGRARAPSPTSSASRGRGVWLRRGLIGAVILTVGVIAGAVIGLTGEVDTVIKELTLPLRHEDIIRQQSREKGVDAALIAAVIYAESKFSDQTSNAGARGLMQITPETAKEIERLSGGTTFKLDDLSDPEINIRYGTFLLHELLDRYDGDEVAALAAYNAGPANADEWGGSGLTMDDIAFPETRAYVEEVLEREGRLPGKVREGAGLLTSERARRVALALAVGLVLADSSVVVLALPDIYRELDTTVSGVTWVLVSFNLVMALAAVPAAMLARRVGPGRAAAVGLAIFAGAGLACGLADQSRP